MHQPSELDLNQPPATNRGVEKQVSASIDWISVTFKKSDKLSYCDAMTREFMECKPLMGYTVAVRYADGRIELSNPSRSEMGTHVIASGQTLRKLAVTPDEWLQHALENSAHCTRLDVAIDARDCHLKAQDATERIESGNCRTRARKFPTWRDPKSKGYTQYIGRKSSSAFVRIYDKAAETGIEADWVRVECSFGAERAQVAARMFLQDHDCIGLILGFVDFDGWKEWTEIMQSSPTLTRYETGLSNTRKWLLEQAAPALAGEVFLDGEDDFYFRFNDAVAFNLEKLKMKASQRSA